MVAAITLWNTIYLERSLTLLGTSQTVDTALLQHVSPLGWEHACLKGDYRLFSRSPHLGALLASERAPVVAALDDYAL